MGALETAARERAYFGALLALSLGALTFALIAQYGFGYEPCLLCQYQRIPYWTLAALALAALCIPQMDRKGTAFLAAAVFACGAALATYHVGVEQNWWQAGACAAPANLSLNFEDFRTAPLQPVAKSCDAIDWTLFGVSMATYNAALSAAMTIVAFVAAAKMKRG